MNSTSTVTTAQAATFARYERILDLEHEVRLVEAIRDFRSSGVPTYRSNQQADNATEARRRLYLAVDALTDEEGANFLAYRRETAKMTNA